MTRRRSRRAWLCRDSANISGRGKTLGAAISPPPTSRQDVACIPLRSRGCAQSPWRKALTKCRDRGFRPRLSRKPPMRLRVSNENGVPLPSAGRGAIADSDIRMRAAISTTRYGGGPPSSSRSARSSSVRSLSSPSVSSPRSPACFAPILSVSRAPSSLGTLVASPSSSSLPPLSSPSSPFSVSRGSFSIPFPSTPPRLSSPLPSCSPRCSASAKEGRSAGEKALRSRQGSVARAAGRSGRHRCPGGSSEARGAGGGPPGRRQDRAGQRGKGQPRCRPAARGEPASLQN
jgi:hypothetical protein